MSFDIDNEGQNVPYAESPGPPQPENVENVQLVWRSNGKAPLQENRQQVMLEVIGASSTGGRLGLDLVAVLDISKSMKKLNRIGKLKTAMQFVIKKLSPIDRLSIVKFSDEAEMVCHLCSVTQACQAQLKDLVDGLRELDATNIRAGLETGIKILNDRRMAGGRVASIFLLCDGDQNIDHATAVDVSDVAVYTFGFGPDSDYEVLDNIARRSKGGTFNFVEDGESMSEPFSQILGGLLSIVVQDLKLTVLPQPGNSTIESVKSGAYPQILGDNTLTVSYGDLFATEVRKIIVDILLPAVNRPKKVTVIIAYCTYRIKGKPFVSRKFAVTIHRTGSAERNAMIISEAVRTEQLRERYIDKLEHARVLIDCGDLHGADAKLLEAKNDLQLERSNSMIDILRTQLDELLELFRVSIGMPACLRSMTTSHRRQRIAETGPVKGVRLFGTQFTGMYREQAKHHEDPTKVLLPVPHDVERANIVRDQPGINRPPMVEAWACCGDWESFQDSSCWACAMVILCTVLAVGATVIGVVLLAMYLRRYRSR